jgi:hypothetical protein
MAVAATVTCVLGSASVALAATAGVPVLGFGGGHPEAAGASPVWTTSQLPEASRVVTRTKDVYDKVVVDLPVRSSHSAVRTPGVDQPVTPAPAPTTDDNSRYEEPHAPRRDLRVDPEDPPTTAAHPSTPEADLPPTTMPTTTTTTRMPGIPADGPPGQPIPPMPPNCYQPKLEDNGVWNCGDD